MHIPERRVSKYAMRENKKMSAIHLKYCREILLENFEFKKSGNIPRPFKGIKTSLVYT